MNKTQKKNKKKTQKKLGMGLSSLLSNDESLASIVKAKIKSKVNAGNDDNKSKATFPSLNVVKSNLDKKIGTLENKEGDQVKLPIQNLISGKFQPRKHFDQTELDELAESIRSNGILQPILVRPLNEKGSSYEIIAGERRWRAAQIVKLHEVPVIIRDFDDSTALGVALIENLQRSDLNIIEEAEGFRSLMLKFEFTQEKLSSQLGKSRSHIANVLRLLSLPNTVKRHISNGDLSFGHARVLVSLPEEKAKEVVEIASSKVTDPIDSLIIFYSLSSSMGWEEGCENAIERLEEDYPDNFRHIQMMFEESMKKGNISSAKKYLERMDHIGPNYEKLVIKYQNRFNRILEITGFSMEEVNEKTKEIGEVHVSNLALDRISEIYSDLTPRKQRPKKRRIMHVSSSMGRGGAERQLINCLRGFRAGKRTKEIGLCTYANQGDESLLPEVIEMGVEIHEYGQNNDLDEEIMENGLGFISDLIKLLPPRFAQDFVQLVGIFKEKRPNIVNSWQDGTNIVAGYAALVSRVPTVLMFGRSMRPDSKTMAHIRNRPYLNGGYKCLLENSRFTLCLNSEQGRKSYAKWLGMEEEKLLILHNGLDLESMKEKQNDLSVEEFLSNSGVLPNSEIVGGVFRFVREKRLSLWVESAFRVLEKRDDIFFIAVGDGPERKNIERIVQEVGFGDKILFPGKTNVVSSWLKKFDLFLLTSEIEGLPNVLIEAQGFGVPVLTTRAGGSEDTFENYDSGVLLIKSDADKIAKQIEICLDDEIWREHAKIRAKDFASEKFSISGMINNLDLIYWTRMSEDYLEWNKEVGLKQKILSIIGVE